MIILQSNEKRWLFLIVFLLTNSLIYSQDQLKADSVKNVIEYRNLSGIDLLSSYYWLSTYSSSPQDRLNYGKELLTLAQTSSDKEYIIKAYKCIGTAHRFAGNLGEALKFLFKAAEEASEQEKYLSILAEVYAEISTCYTQNGDSENALFYGSKTISILRKTDQKQLLALSLLNTGYDYYLIGNYDSAMTYYNESEPILHEIGMNLGLAYIIGNRALVYWKKGNLKKAKEDLTKSIDLLEPLGDTYAMADYYNQLGNIYLEEENPDEAVRFSGKGFEMARNEGFKEQARDASNLLYLSYRDIGDYKKALDYLNQYYSYRDSIQNLETTQQIADLRTEFEVGQKQAEVDLLLEQKRSNQIIMITGGIILVAVLGLVIVIFLYSRSKNRLNEQLEEQKDSLIQLNQTKDKFFSIISHDLRGPVNSLTGLVNVTKYFINSGNSDQLQEVIEKMEISIDRLIRLLDNLLTWALQQRGHFPYLPEPLNLKNISGEVIEMFSDMAVAKDIKLEYEVDDSISLYADKNATSTILRNLINNAIKFTPEGGSVQISAEADQEKQLGVIKVTDSGVGMPQGKLDKLFGLNEKISTRGTSGETGLGLGLQLVFEFVELNKGTIEVESKPDKGTTFTISLPLAA